MSIFVRKEKVKMTTVRPKTIDSFLGQEPIKDQVKVAIASAKERDCPFPHMIMGGPPGLGKTTLASIIANEMNGVLISRIASAITKPDDLLDLFKQLKQINTIIFLDEIEKLNRKISELLHTAMEDGIFTAKLSNGKIVEVKLPEFTLMGATNYLGELPRPFLDRFKIQVNFEVYSEDEIYTIVCGAVKKMNLIATKDGAKEIARRSRGVPRVAIRYLEAARDVSLAFKEKYKGITSKCVEEMFDMQRVDEIGLTNIDIKVLEFLNKFETPMGLKAIAQGVNEDVSTVEFSESYMIQLGLVCRNLRGRTITDKGKEHIKELIC
jgi:Holliday junction DNA helicase RuvB